MKLKDFSGDQMAEVLCTIAEPVEHITQDEEVLEAIKKLAEERQKGGVLGKLAGFAYARFVPLLLKKHKEDTYTILAAFSGKSVQEVASGSAVALFGMLKDLLTPENVRFFTSSVDSEQAE